jgi:signal transduction histidine kinase
MAHEDINSIELEETSEELKKKLPRSSGRLAVVNEERKTGNRIHRSDIGKIAHDFRASLNIIIGYAELMQDEVPGKINEEQRRGLSDILKYSKRMLDLVNDIEKQS